MDTTSLAAMAMMSEHETVRGQAISSLVLASSITKNDRTEILGGPSFSAWFPGVESSKIDASHPYIINKLITQLIKSHTISYVD